MLVLNSSRITVPYRVESYLLVLLVLNESNGYTRQTPEIHARTLSLACFELLVLNLNIVVYTLVTTLSLACFEPAFMYIT